MIKKILSLGLAVLLVLGLAVPAFAAPVTPVVLGLSAQSTVVNGEAPTTTLGTTLKVGDTFDVVFDKSAFTWTGSGTGYGPGKIIPAWIKMTGPLLGSDLTITYAGVDPTSGSYAVTFLAAKTYTGPISIYLDSSADSTRKTKAISLPTITITEAVSFITQTKAGTTALTASHSGAVSLKVGDKITYQIPADHFVWSPLVGIKNAVLLTDLSWIKVNGAVIGTDFDIAYSTPVGATGTVGVTLTARKAGSYSGLSLFLQGGGGAATLVSAPLTATVTEPVTNYTAEKTIPGGGTVTTNLPANLKIGDTFTVTFSKDSISWNGNGGTYQAGKLVPAWVKINSAVTRSSNFSVVGTALNPTTGQYVATLKALTAFSGTLNVALDSGAGATKSLAQAVTVTDPATASQIAKTKAGGTAPTASRTGTVTMQPGEQITYKISADNFEWNPVGGTPNASLLTDTSWVRLGGATPGVDFEVAYSTPVGTTGEVGVTLTARRAGSYPKLTLSLRGGGGADTTPSPLLNVTVASQTTAGRITGIAGDAQLGGKGSGAVLNGTIIPHGQLYNLSVRYGDELLLPLTAGFFTWEGTVPYPNSPVTLSQLREARIKVGISGRKGANVFESGTPELVTKNEQAHVKIKFAKAGTTNKDVDFSMLTYLSINKTRHTGSQLQIEGTVVIDLIDIYDDNSYYDISDGSAVEADTFLRNVSLYLGAGVTVQGNLMSGKRYSGTATFDIRAADDEVLSKYPSIQEIITLKTYGLDRASNKVTMDLQRENYYVYNSAGKYLGRSGDKLEYSNKYYLSTKKIDMDLGGDLLEPSPGGINEPGPGDILEPPAVIPPEYVTPPNVNYNPGTGR